MTAPKGIGRALSNLSKHLYREAMKMNRRNESDWAVNWASGLREAALIAARAARRRAAKKAKKR